VPALDRVDGVLEDRHGGLERQAVPQIGPEEVVRHGKQM
jgi:hypothetical protein